MALFRRKQETLNEQLLREAGLDDVSQALRDPPPVSEPPDPGPFPVGNANLGGQSSRRPRRGGETMVTLRAAALPGDRIEFTTLPDGDIIVDEAKGDGDLAPCAEAVERHVDPPYRAIAVRQGGDLWAVQASRIQVAKFEFAEGDAIVLSGERRHRGSSGRRRAERGAGARARAARRAGRPELLRRGGANRRRLLGGQSPAALGRYA